MPVLFWCHLNAIAVSPGCYKAQTKFNSHLLLETNIAFCPEMPGLQKT